METLSSSPPIISTPVTSVTPSLIVNATSGGGCINNNGEEVASGMLYVPIGPDDCQACTCVSGKPAFCWTVLCAPPSCRALRVKNRCCKWICLDEASNGVKRIPTLSNGSPAGPSNGGNFINVNVNTYNPSGADIGLRLVASSVTAILSLCLLFFLIYRLRRRKMRRHRAHAVALAAISGQQRDQTDMDDQQSIDSVTIVASDGGTGDSRRLYVDVGNRSAGYLAAWWKPPEFFENRTAPPSYDDAVMYEGARSRVLAHTLPSARHLRSAAQTAADEEDEYSSDSYSEAPAYSDIHGDAVLIYPTSGPQSDPGQRSVCLPRGAMLVLPEPAPPASQLHHVPDNQRSDITVNDTDNEDMQLDDTIETITAEV